MSEEKRTIPLNPGRMTMSNEIPGPIAQLFDGDRSTPSIVFDDGYTASYHGSYEYGEGITSGYLHWLNEEMAHYLLRQWTKHVLGKQEGVI